MDEDNETFVALKKAMELGVPLEPLPEMPASMVQYHEWIQAQIAKSGWTHEGGGIYHKTTETDQPWVVPEWD